MRRKGECDAYRLWRRLRRERGRCLGYSVFFSRSFLTRQRGAEEPLRAADKGIAALIDAKKLVGGAGQPDANGFADGPNRMVRDAKPKGTGSAAVEPVVAGVCLTGRRRNGARRGE